MLKLSAAELILFIRRSLKTFGN